MFDFCLGFAAGMLLSIAIFANIVEDAQHDQKIQCYEQYTQKENQKKCLDIVEQSK